MSPRRSPRCSPGTASTSCTPAAARRRCGSCCPTDATPFGVVLLDLGLPDQDGFEVCGRIRKITSTPVIMVTARADVRSRIHGLNLGADDYVVKPYDTGELLARIHAVSRRTAPGERGAARRGAAPPTALRLGAVTIELPTRQVSVDGAVVPADPQGVRPAGAARPAARCRLPPGADHQRGLAHELGGDRPHPGGACRLPALQAAACPR